MAKMAKAALRNPADLTLRNLHALKKRIEALDKRVKKLEAAMKGKPLPVF